jgi:hypothetical protein
MFESNLELVHRAPSAEVSDRIDALEAAGLSG